MSVRRGPTPSHPRFWRWLVARFTHEADRAYVLADLDDLWEERVERDGVRLARRWYRMEALRSAWAGARRGRQIRKARRIEAIRQERGQTRVERWEGMMKDWIAELGYALRTLVRTPITVVVTLLSLGLAIGGVTAVFSFANAFLLRGDPAVSEAERLGVVWVSGGDGEAFSFASYPDFESVAESVEAFESLAATGVDVRYLGQRHEGPQITVEVVTGSFFRTLGVQLLSGRGFLPEETIPGQAEPVIVLGEAFWESQLAREPAVLGSTVEINGTDYTVVGIAPETLRGRLLNLQVDGWVPMGIPNTGGRRTVDALYNRSDRDFMVFGRFAEGATAAEAEAQLANLSRQLYATYPDDWADEAGDSRFFSLTTGTHAQMARPMKLALLGAVGMLFAATALVLGIACANVAGVLLARARRRRREMAVRAALGAGRGRLARLLLTESLLLGLGAGVIGVFLAHQLVSALNTLELPIAVPLRFDFGIDYTVLGFAVLLSVGTAALFGLAPALEGSRPDVVQSLKGEAPETRRRRWWGRVRLREALVVVQVAVSMVLLVGASLLLRGLGVAASADRGFDGQGVAVVAKTLVDEAQEHANYRAAMDEIALELQARPGVETVAFSRGLEAGFTGDQHRADLAVPGYEPAPGEGMTVEYNSVTPEYLDLMRIDVLRGRGILESDGPGALPVVVVNESFARRFWPELDPIGRTIRIEGRRIFGDRISGDATEFQVVGVAEDLAPREVGQSAAPFLWTALIQDPGQWLTVVVRGAGGPGAEAADMVAHLRDVMEYRDGEQPIVAPQTFENLLAFDLLAQRAASRGLLVGGGFGLLLAVIGVYGIVSFVVSQRLRELAIRVALGAERKEIAWAVLRSGLGLVGSGVLVGLILSAPVGRLLESNIFGVSGMDPLAASAAAGSLLLAGLLATLVPMRRALRLDPMQVLRSE